MSMALIGALVGLGVALVDIVLLRVLASRVDLPETKRVLNVAGLSQLFLLPLMGYFLAPVLFGD
jgi:phosphate/sulfate permease